MKCPYCAYHDSRVVDSRPAEDGSSIRRRRECGECGKRFTTYEKIEEIPIRVIKKDGNRQAYDRNKVLRGLIRSCEKRPVTSEAIESIIEDVEKAIYNSSGREISSTEIGELVMARLRKIDEVAYVRFVSVYRDFKDLNSFIEEFNNILNESE